MGSEDDIVDGILHMLGELIKMMWATFIETIKMMFVFLKEIFSMLFSSLKKGSP